jgi:hypothetical protein
MSTLIGAETGIKIIAAVHIQCLLWVKSTHYRATALLSAFAPISRPQRHGLNATLCAICGLMHRSKKASLFDDVVGELLKVQRHFEAERLGGLEIDHQLKLDRGLDGKLVRLRTLEDAIGI